MKKNSWILFSFLFFACASHKNGKHSSKGVGDTRTKAVELIDNNTYLLVDKTEDATYGFKVSNPIKVGGISDGNGPLNERRFLNALLGPGGEKVYYYRAGSCCHFKTPNGLIENIGLLDLYKIYWKGSDTLSVYINMYDNGDLAIPVGLNAKTKE